MAPTFTRRQFMQSAATAVAAGAATTTLPGCPPTPIPEGGMVVFKRSGRGRRVSNAAKKHNANMLYQTFDAAMADIPHPGDTSKVVELTISNERFDKLFPTSNVLSADLRHDL